MGDISLVPNRDLEYHYMKNITGMYRRRSSSIEIYGFEHVIILIRQTTLLLSIMYAERNENHEYIYSIFLSPAGKQTVHLYASYCNATMMIQHNLFHISLSLFHFHSLSTSLHDPILYTIGVVV